MVREPDPDRLTITLHDDDSVVKHLFDNVPQAGTPNSN